MLSKILNMRDKITGRYTSKKLQGDGPQIIISTIDFLGDQRTNLKFLPRRREPSIKKKNLIKFFIIVTSASLIADISSMLAPIRPPPQRPIPALLPRGSIPPVYQICRVPEPLLLPSFLPPRGINCWRTDVLSPIFGNRLRSLRLSFLPRVLLNFAAPRTPSPPLPFLA